ncbi:MAG: helix-turn-helix domain-containing protein [Oscillospiraceae bacterium]|nr:helix-turn-helix domain-containing protein [Oscillospiraceae bacterium]
MTGIEFHARLKQNDSWSMSRLHFHDYYELMLPLTSSGSIFVKDQIYPLQRGQLYLISENTLHRTIANGFHSRYVLHVSRRTLTELSTQQTDFVRLLQDPFRCVPLEQTQFEQLSCLFQSLDNCQNDGEFGSDLRQTVSLIELLLAASQILHLSPADDIAQSKDFARINPILDYIHDNLTEPLSLDRIAGHFFLNKHYLCRIFKAATGFSVMDYIIRSRVLRARQLLLEGVSVQQAGEQAGFADNSHFIRTFGNLTGTSPGRYAREYQSGEQVHIDN